MRIGPIRLGRFTPFQGARFGLALQAMGGCGYVAFGPVTVMVTLPRRLRKAEPEPTLFDLNAHLRRQAEARQD